MSSRVKGAITSEFGLEQPTPLGATHKSLFQFTEDFLIDVSIDGGDDPSLQDSRSA